MKVAFLDRDGTMIFEPADGLVRPGDFRVLPGVIESLKQLQEDGYALVMATNQSFDKKPEWQECFEKTQIMLIDALKKEGVIFTDILLCPHSELIGCTCRKPKTGMVDPFLKTHTIDKVNSFVAGDREKNDGGLAKNLGIAYVKVESNMRFPDAAIILERLVK